MNTDDDHLITLAEYAREVDRDETTVRYVWTRHPTFPAPVSGRRRKAPGQTRGPGAAVYRRDDLRHWHGTDGPAGAPPKLVVPAGQDPTDRMTLGAIARILGLDGRTVSQYRARIEQQIKPVIRGTRQLYPLGAVVDVLNSRRGPGATHAE